MGGKPDGQEWMDTVVIDTDEDGYVVGIELVQGTGGKWMNLTSKAGLWMRHNKESGKAEHLPPSGTKEQQEAALLELTRLTEEMGLYDDQAPPGDDRPQ